MTDAFRALSDHERDTIIEFLKSLQILPVGTRALVIDDRGRPIQWPPVGNPSTTTSARLRASRSPIS